MVQPTITIEDVIWHYPSRQLIVGYEAFDSDSVATISFALDTDNKGANGTLLGMVDESDGRGSINLPAGSVAAGTYYVYAVVSDGDSAPVTTYSQPVTITDQALSFRMFASTGFAGEVGGTGLIVGTTGLQEIEILDIPGKYTFDPSFNRGGDLLRLSDDADAFTIVRSGSSVVLTDDTRTITIPVGSVGTQLGFADGIRTLAFDGNSGGVKLGTQVVGNVAAPVTAPAEDSPLPTDSDDSAIARVFLESGAEVAVGGRFQVFGTDGDEGVTYLSGDLVLDPSFNRGGDILHLPDAATTYSARLSGSAIILSSQDGTVSIPVGTTGMVLDFAGEERFLRFNLAFKDVRIDDQTITSSNVALIA